MLRRMQLWCWRLSFLVDLNHILFSFFSGNFEGLELKLILSTKVKSFIVLWKIQLSNLMQTKISFFDTNTVIKIYKLLPVDTQDLNLVKRKILWHKWKKNSKKHQFLILCRIIMWQNYFLVCFFFTQYLHT